MSHSRTTQLARSFMRTHIPWVIALQLVVAVPVRGYDYDPPPPPLWAFWYTSNDKLYNEMAGSKDECRAAARKWEKDASLGPIVFRCAEVSERLLREANVRCRKNKPFGCLWHDDIEMLLEIRAENGRRK